MPWVNFFMDNIQRKLLSEQFRIPGQRVIVGSVGGDIGKYENAYPQTDHVKLRDYLRCAVVLSWAGLQQ